MGECVLGLLRAQPFLAHPLFDRGLRRTQSYKGYWLRIARPSFNPRLPVVHRPSIQMGFPARMPIAKPLGLASFLPRRLPARTFVQYTERT